MTAIPQSKIDEWNSEYNNSIYQDEISRISYLMHCAALWGYDQGLTAMNNLFNIDPEWS
jgi:hypothetical protein